MLIRYIGNIECDEVESFFTKGNVYRAIVDEDGVSLYSSDNNSDEDDSYDDKSYCSHMVAYIYDEEGEAICDVDNVPSDFYLLDKWFVENFEIVKEENKDEQ